MKKLLLLIALLAVAAGSRVCGEVQTDRPCLVPWPQKITMREGSFIAPKALSIAIAGRNMAATRRVAETFANDLAEMGFAPPWTDSSPMIFLALSADKTLGAEGYRLKVDKDIRITAATETGLFWGTRTALQLLANGPGQPVSRMSIFDKPLIPLRIVMIDVARQFHSIGFHRQFVKKLASYKLNAYHIHFSDDQSYTLPSDKYPSLPTPNRHYAKEELEALVRLAGQYHVMIIPEVEMPGHNSALCAGVPDVVCRGKKPAGTVCVGSNRSFEVLKNLITETMDIFPAPYFHIGADEVGFEAWDNCPDCEHRKLSEGLKSNESLYNWFINRCNRFVRSKGRRTIVWNCVNPASRPTIDKNVLVDQWNIAFTKPGDLVSAGYDLVNASCEPLYAFKTFAAFSPEQLAEWNVWRFGLASKPVSDDSPCIAPTKQLKGVCYCSWENTEKVQNAILFGDGDSAKGFASPAPRVPVVAERAWTGNATTAADLLGRVGWKAGK
jgi:hexosaminidase